MTRVETHFPLAAPLDDNALLEISKAHSVYGILRIRPVDDHEIVVEYDATRLRPNEVRSILAGAGVRIDSK